MNKIFPLVIAGAVLSNVVFADTAPVVDISDQNSKPLAASTSTNNTTSTTAMSNEAAVSVSSDMRIASLSKHQEDNQIGYTIDSKYPQIQGENLSAGAKEFNLVIEKAVNEEIDEFKKSVALDRPHMQTLPEGARTNSMKVDYDVDVVKPKNSTIISVRMTFEGMQAGRAHPYHSNRVINFDLQAGKILTLGDLFKKDSHFLKTLAAYTSNSLNHKLKKDNWMVQQGTKADVKNFKNWNIQADSILITFDEYQVAPYSYGAQEVEIPYTQLKKVLSNKAPIADCVSDAKNCQVG